MEAGQLRADDLYNTHFDPRFQADALASMPSSHETNVITTPFPPETPVHFSVPLMSWIQESPLSMHSHSLTPSSISPPIVAAGPTPLIPVVVDALPQSSPSLPPPPTEAIEQSPSPPVHSQAILSDDAVPSLTAGSTPTAIEKKKSKKRPESHDAHGIPIPKRPVGRPRKDGKPAGSQGPRKTNRRPGRPRKNEIPNGTTTIPINSLSSPVKQLGSVSQMGTPQSSGGGDANPYSPSGPDQASTSAMSLDQPGPSTLPFSQSETSGTPAYDDLSCSQAEATMDQDFNNSSYDMSISHSPDASRSVTSPSMLSSVTGTSASDWTDVWSEQEITNADAFLETLVSLLSSLPSPSPSSSSSFCSSSKVTMPGVIRYTLEQSFKIRLALVRRQSTRASSSSSSTHLHQHQHPHQHQHQHQPHSHLPGVYDLFQSFWLSSSSPYFAHTVAPSLQVPSEHRFFFWHPMPLCPGATIICPACGTAPLVDNGPIASGPVRIWDFEPYGGGFYVIGCEYVCRSVVCVAATAAGGADEGIMAAAANGRGRTFASTDHAILRGLPQALQDDFPAFMVMAGPGARAREVWDFRTVGVSRAVWALARSLVLRVKMGKQMVMQVLGGMQQQQGLGLGMGAGERDEPWLREERGLQYHQQQQQEEEDAFGGMRRSSLDQGVQEHPSVQFLHHHHQQHQHQHQQLRQHQHQHQQTASSFAAFMSSNQPGMYDQGGLSHPLGASGYGHMVHHAELDSELPYEVEHSPLAASSVQSPQTSQSKSPSAPSAAATATPSSSSSSSVTTTTAPTPISAPAEYDGPLTYPTQTYYAMPSATGSPREYDLSQQYGPSPPPTGLVDAITQVPKKLRHCCKCGQIMCKGKGGRTHCQNPCQDCHRYECRGRNSKRPDKTCEFAWME